MGKNMLFSDISAMPVIPLPGMVLLPSTAVHFDVRHKKSMAALDAAMEADQLVFLTAQKNPEDEAPSLEGLEPVGVIGKIKQIVRQPKQAQRVLVEGVRRAVITELLQTEPCLLGLIARQDGDDETHSPLECEAMKRQVETYFEAYLAVRNKLTPDIMHRLQHIDAYDAFADFVASNLQLSAKNSQRILNCAGCYDRLECILEILMQEVELLELEKEIAVKVKQRIESNQREYFLREQMKVLQEELGDKDGIGQEIREYREKLLELEVPPEVMRKCERELDRLERLTGGHPEAGTVRNYLSWICELPWNKKTEQSIDLQRAQRILDRDHYGLQNVKERIVEYLAVRKLTGTLKGPILLLVGPPGVGKTSIARSVAESLGRSYVRISLGGVRDEADIRGHRVTYIGAMPGRIITALKQAGSSNPLMLLDELDKMSSDYRGDPAAAMLEVLDSEQNCHFHDHYLDVDYDLSDVLFLATANTTDTIPRPLLDRMEVIRLDSYTFDEKQHIARRHLLPKQRKAHGLTARALSVSDGALDAIVDGYTREAGVRALERRLGDICRKAARALSEGDVQRVSVTVRNISDFLGPRKFMPAHAARRDEAGVVTGLAWTQAGGDTLCVEANIMKGKGALELTGQLGDVMKESAHAAVSYIRANAAALGVNEDFYRNLDIHIHVPEGATPKDGPSAGVTIATALVSALTGRTARADVAMTGEITLRGRVLPIGGLKEKTLAAYRAGIKTVVFPADNQKDLSEIDQDIRRQLRFVAVDCAEQAIRTALNPR